MMTPCDSKMLLINFLSLPRLLPRSSTIAHVEIYASAISGKRKKNCESGGYVIGLDEVECHEPLLLWRFSLFEVFSINMSQERALAVTDCDMDTIGACLWQHSR